MKNKILPFSLTFIFIIIFIIFYRGLQDTNIYTPKTKNNNKVPLTTVKLFYSDQNINLSKIFLSNKFYLVNIWSSWCIPCRQEHTLLMNLAENENVEIIGINYKDSKLNAEDFLKNLGNPYKKILFDNDGTHSIEWGAFGVPESFLIYNNKVIKKYIGPLNEVSVKEIKLIIK